MPNFTKGKWRIADYIGVGWDIVDERGFNIAAQVCQDDDARLIAAAPEMYRILCNIRDELSEVDLDPDTEDDIYEVLKAIDGKEAQI